MKGIQINVRLLIAEYMEKLTQANPSLLGYPFLITQLLIKQEIPMREEKAIRPLDPIIAAYIRGQLDECNTNSPPREYLRRGTREKGRLDPTAVDVRLVRVEEGMGRIVSDIADLKRERLTITRLSSPL